MDNYFQFNLKYSSKFSKSMKNIAIIKLLSSQYTVWNHDKENGKKETLDTHVVTYTNVGLHWSHNEGRKNTIIEEFEQREMISEKGS